MASAIPFKTWNSARGWISGGASSPHSLRHPPPSTSRIADRLEGSCGFSIALFGTMTHTTCFQVTSFHFCETMCKRATRLEPI